MAGKVRRWMWVVFGLVLTCVLTVVVLAGAGVYFFSRHLETRSATPAAASREFEAATARFRGQKPLVELDRRGNFRRASPGRSAAVGSSAPEQLNVLAFDAEDGRVVRLTIPFWLLRLKIGGGSVDLNGSRMDLEDLKLSVQELERFGPTLIVDHDGADGNRVLVWSQ